MLPGGALVETVKIEIDRNDPNKGVISVDQDGSLLQGQKRTHKAWRDNNLALAKDLEALFTVAAKNTLWKVLLQLMVAAFKSFSGKII